MQVQIVLKRLKKIPEVQAVYLFGSYAKNKHRPVSDIDIAVLLYPFTKESEAEAGANSNRMVQVSIFNRLPPFLKWDIVKNGKKLFVRDKEIVRELEIRAIKEYHEHVPLYRRNGWIK